MTFDGNRTSRFARALREYGFERCSAAGSVLCVGLRPDPDLGLSPVEAASADPRAVSFLRAPVQADLIAAFVASPEAAGVERLTIGTSHDYAREVAGRPVASSYDMRAAVAALRGADLPALRHLSLGDMERLHNGHRLFGRLGDVAHVFAAAPRLETLDLQGQFGLAASVRHGTLRGLAAALDDIGVSGGPLSRDGLRHLLSSDFPRLERLDLSLEQEDREGDYDIPEAFFAGTGFPALEAIALDCLTSDAQRRLNDWKRARGLR